MKARTLLPAVVLAAGVLGLCSCRFLLSGLFPGDLAQATARWLLPSGIPAEITPTYSLAILRSGTSDYVVLFTSSRFSGTQMFVMDQNLVLLQEWSDTALSAIFPGGIFDGKRAMTDSSGAFVIGNARFSAGGPGLSSLGSVGVALWSDSVATVDGNFVNFETDGSTMLRYDEWDTGWAAGTPLSVPIGAAGSTYWLRGVVTAPAESWVILGIGENVDFSHTSFHFIIIPKAAIASGLIGPLLTTYTPLTWKDVDVSLVAYAPHGLLAYEQRSGDLVEFALGAPTNEKRVHIGKLSEGVQIAVSPGGSYYCVWNPATRSIMRMESWWEQ